MTYYRGKHLTRTFLQCCDGQMTPGTRDFQNRLHQHHHNWQFNSGDGSLQIFTKWHNASDNGVVGPWFVKASSQISGQGLSWCVSADGSDHWSPAEVTSGTWGPGVPWCHCSLRCSLTLLRRHSSAQIRVSSYNLELACPSLAIQSLITLQLIFLSLHRV